MELPEEYVKEVQDFFQEEYGKQVELLGNYSVRNPVTRRSSNLNTESKQRNFLKRLKQQKKVLVNYQTGLSGYKFKKCKKQKSELFQTFELKLKYGLPMNRMLIDMPKFLNDFFREQNVSPSSRLRIAGQYDSPIGKQWVSERIMSPEQLIEEIQSRPLFLREELGAEYGERTALEAISRFSLNVYVRD